MEANTRTLAAVKLNQISQAFLWLCIAVAVLTILFVLLLPAAIQVIESYTGRPLDIRIAAPAPPIKILHDYNPPAD